MAAKPPNYYKKFLTERNSDKKKVAIIGSRKYETRQKIKETIWQLITNFGRDNIVVVSGGCPTGADKYAKQFADEFDLLYEEFNPSHTEHNVDSVMQKSFFGKEFSKYNFIYRNELIALYCHFAIAFIDSKSDNTGTMSAIKFFEKYEKKVIILDEKE